MLQHLAQERMKVSQTLEELSQCQQQLQLSYQQSMRAKEQGTQK